MSIFIKESFNFKPAMLKEGNDSNINSEGITIKESYSEVIGRDECISEDSITQIIEGIHVGPTRNSTWYMAEALRDSIPYWTTPYKRPVIMHHNEEDGVTIGRVHSVEYVEHNTLSGTPALNFTCNIADPEGIKQILDGRLLTVSVSGSAKDVRCSICGKHIELNEDGEEVCGHNKGYVYNGQKAYWNIYKFEPKEISYVIVPSDIYAQNIKTIRRINGEDVLIAEQNKVKGDVIPMQEVNNKEQIKVAESAEGTIPVEIPAVDPKAEGTGEVEVPKTEPAKEATVEKKELELLKEQVETLTLKVAELEGKNTELATENITVKESLNKEIKLRESLEAESHKMIIELKESKLNSINAMRTSLNRKTIAVETLKERSLESLNDSIMDLKEELNLNAPEISLKEAANETVAPVKETEVPEVTVQESLSQVGKPEVKAEEIIKNSNSVVIKESNTSNIDFDKKFTDLLSRMI